MACTLKIIAGPETGQEFNCSTPETYLGRSQRCLIRLSSASISFEHALISRIADDFYIENLSANGTLLNNQRLAVKTRLRAKDQIQLGSETVARVERVPAASAAAGNRRWLLVAFVCLLLIALVIVVVDPFAASASSGDQQQVYRLFQDFAADQVAHNGMPTTPPALLADAWRLQMSGDRTQALKAWVKVEVQLDAWDRSQDRVDTLHSTRGLDSLLSGDKKSLPPEDLRIALKQWVLRMERK